jgi:hypothetical protein
MRIKTPPPALVGGPYKTPRIKPGQSVACLIRGEVEVDGLSEGVRSTAEGAPLAWPYLLRCPPVDRRSLVLCADLVKAVKVESSQAVCHYWGISRDTVYNLRRALGVGRVNPGTRNLLRVLWAAKLTPDRLAKGGRNARANDLARKA